MKENLINKKPGFGFKTGIWLVIRVVNSTGIGWSNRFWMFNRFWVFNQFWVFNRFWVFNWIWLDVPVIVFSI